MTTRKLSISCTCHQYYKASKPIMMTLQIENFYEAMSECSQILISSYSGNYKILCIDLAQDSKKNFLVEKKTYHL